MIDGIDQTTLLLAIIYGMVEAVKFTVNRTIDQKRTLEILADIARSQDSIAENQKISSIINQELLEEIKEYRRGNAKAGENCYRPDEEMEAPPYAAARKY